MNATLLPYALCGYSLPHAMGYLPAKDGTAASPTLTPLGLVLAAKEMNLAGVEFALSSKVPSFDGAVIDTGEGDADWGAILKEQNLRLVADYGAILDNDAQHLKDYLKTAAEAGAKVVRAVLSHLLCGDRRKMEGGWEAHRERLAARLREVLPFAEALGVCLAVENHQDATSDDLLWLAEATGDSPAFGVTLDTGNPLAVAEEPIEYTARIAPLVRHVHMKDYTLHRAPEGYRLVRCAAGAGVIPFREMLALVAQNGQDVLPAIEVAAQATRTIPVNEPDWWQCYPAKQRAYFEAVTPLLEAAARPAEEPYSSAWERGETSEAVLAEEWRVVRESVAYFAVLGSR